MADFLNFFSKKKNVSLCSVELFDECFVHEQEKKRRREEEEQDLFLILMNFSNKILLVMESAGRFLDEEIFVELNERTFPCQHCGVLIDSGKSRRKQKGSIVDVTGVRFFQIARLKARGKSHLFCTVEVRSHSGILVPGSCLVDQLEIDFLSDQVTLLMSNFPFRQEK